MIVKDPTSEYETLACDDCGSGDEKVRPFQIQTRSTKTPCKRLDLCQACRRTHPKAYRIFGQGKIAIPEAGFTTHKRTVNNKNYLLTVHSNGRVVIHRQNVSTQKYGAYGTPAERAAVLAAVGPQDGYLDMPY